MQKLISLQALEIINTKEAIVRSKRDRLKQNSDKLQVVKLSYKILTMVLEQTMSTAPSDMIPMIILFVPSVRKKSL